VLKRISKFAVLVAGCGVFIAGCSDNTQVGTIQITPATQSLNAGQTAQFTATGIIGHGKHPPTTQDVTSLVTWSSNAPAIATISPTGLASAVSAGTATISASLAGATSATATITVTGGTPGKAGNNIVSIGVIPGSQSVAAPGQTAQFIAIGTTAAGVTLDLTNQVSWTSSSTEIATVGASTGIASGVSQGTATVTALYTNTSDQSVVTGTATFQVMGGTTEQITNLTIYPGSQSTTALDQQTQFFVLGTQGASGLQFDLTSQVAWSSSNRAVVTIGTPGSGTPGLATSVGAGSSTITATYTNSDSSKVVATATYSATTGQSPELLLSVNVVPSDVTVSNKGMTAQFLAFGTYSTSPTVRDITNSVTWISTLPEVASISSCGSGSGANCGTTTGGGPSGGLQGEYAGLATSQGYTGNTVIYALDNTTNPDGTVVLSNPQTFTCKDAVAEVCVQQVPTPQFATITVFIEGEQTAASGEYVTAPSDTGTPNLIHCGKDYPGPDGQVCTGTYAVGSKVTLTENLPAGSSSFGGWSTGSGCVDASGNPLTAQQLETSTTCTVSVNGKTGLNGNLSVGVIFY
jgi:hypothetical protein